jgi:hypothetical protein
MQIPQSQKNAGYVAQHYTQIPRSQKRGICGKTLSANPAVAKRMRDLWHYTILMLRRTSTTSPTTCHGSQRQKRSTHSTKIGFFDCCLNAGHIEDDDKNEAIIMISITNI